MRHNLKLGWTHCKVEEEKNNIALFIVIGAVIGAVAWLQISKHLSEVIILEDIIYKIYG